MSSGRSVKLFLADGTAAGILTAEIMNWTGHVLAAPRTRFEDAFAREEMRRTGIYFLIGPDEDGTGLTSVYVGEGDEIGKRLYSHNKDKDFWDRFIAVTSKDMNLTKAHVRYLEGKVLSLIKDAKRASIENKDMPLFELLPEADISDMDAFLEEIQLVLPVIGVDLLRKSSRLSPPHTDPDPKNSEAGTAAGKVFFTLSNAKAGIEAKAYELGGEFVLQQQSTGALREKVSFNEALRILRQDAMKTGRISEVSSKQFKLEQDMPFGSPSAASAFLFGTSRNGRADWIVEGQETRYGRWKDTLVDEVYRSNF